MDLEELIRRYDRGERDFIAINLPDLLDVNLEGINLTRSNIGNCTNVNLKYANLSQADLHFSQMNKVNLDNAKLIQADIQECNWSEVSLARAKLMQSDLSFSVFERCNFERADLSHSIMQEGGFLRSNCKQINMEMAFFCMCAFSYSDFEAASCYQMHFGENEVVSCNFKNVRGADLSDLAGNTLQEVILPNGEVVDRQIWESFD